MDVATLASQAGWQPDSITNLIALPANEAAQAKRAAIDGFILPIHNSSHSAYDLEVHGQIVIEEEKYYDMPTMTLTLTPMQARAIFEEVAMEMQRQIRTGRWMPRLR